MKFWILLMFTLFIVGACFLQFGYPIIAEAFAFCSFLILFGLMMNL